MIIGLRIIIEENIRWDGLKMDKDKLIVFEERNGIVDLKEKIQEEIKDNGELTERQKKSLYDDVETAICNWVYGEMV